MLINSIPEITCGFIPTIFNPLIYNEEWGRAAEVKYKVEVLSEQTYFFLSVAEISQYLIFAVIAINVIVLVMCFGQAWQEKKFRIALAGLFPVMNLTFLSKYRNISTWFLIVYSLIHLCALIDLTYIIYLFYGLNV